MEALYTRDLLGVIFEFLPPKDRILTIPKVNQLWGTVVDPHVAYKELAKQLMRGEINLYKFDEGQIDTILQLAVKSKIIYKALNLKTKFRCDKTFKTAVTLPNDDREVWLEATANCYRSKSEKIRLYWDPNTLELSTNRKKWGDYFSNYSLESNLVKQNFDNYALLPHGRFFVSTGWHVKRLKFLDVLFPIPRENQHINIQLLIKYSIELAFRIQVTYLTYLNMGVFSDLSLKSFEEDNIGVVYTCNEYGKIGRPLKLDEKGFMKLKIIKKIFDDGVEALVFVFDDLEDIFKKECTVRDQLRGNILDKTREDLSNRLKIPVLQVFSENV